MIPLDLMVPPAPVVPLTPRGWVGYGLLFLLAAVTTTGAGRAVPVVRTRAAALCLGAAGLLATIPIDRFFRAVAPGDRPHFWLLVMVLAVTGAGVCWAVGDGYGTGRPLALVAWLAASVVACGLDRWQEYMASIPLSWGLLIAAGVIGAVLVLDRS